MSLVPKSLDRTQLSPCAILAIGQWLNGEISGEMCLQTVIDDKPFFIGASSGNIAGAFIGSFVAGPLGFVVGGLIGAVAGGTFVSILFRVLFGGPVADALNNAYTFLDCSPDATIGDINSSYRQLSLKYHPDKGGDREMWTLLQCSMEVIRASKEKA